MISLLLILLPILGALILFSTSDDTKSFSIASIFSIASLILFVFGLKHYLANPQDTLLDFNIAWISSLSINFHIAWDGLSTLMVGLTAIVILLIVFSTQGIAYANRNKLLGLILLTQAALMGVFMAKDTFVFYFFFEIALVPVYLIANIWGGENASKITFKMLVYTIFGSLFMLVAFVLLYWRAQSTDIDSIRATVSFLPETIQNFVFFAFLLAFAIKSPIFPFHTWLPDTYTESPTPATMLLSGLLSKMGIFGMIKILLPLAPSGVALYSNIIISLSIVGLIYGSIIAIQQDSLKRLLAYSSFAHMGIMAGAVFTQSAEGIQGAIFQMIAHGINVVGLFYIVKIIFERTGSRSLSALGGISQKAPVFTVIFMIILLGSVALPLTNGFIGEFLMLKSIFDFNNILGIISALSIILGAVYLLRMFQKTVFGPLAINTTDFEDLKKSELLILVPVALIIILTGVFPNIILEVSEPFTNGLLGISK